MSDRLQEIICKITLISLILLIRRAAPASEMQNISLLYNSLWLLILVINQLDAQNIVLQ